MAATAALEEVLPRNDSPCNDVLLGCGKQPSGGKKRSGGLER